MNDDQLLRYSRHILLPEIDVRGQQALIDSHVLIVGLGGLGSPIALYLAAAGVGEITLVDDDVVDVSNLQRQISHHTQDVGRRKVDSAKDKLAAMNPDVKINVVPTRLDQTQLETIIDSVSLVMDATDNFSTRVTLNRVCLKAQKPVVYGAAVRLEGQIFVFDPNEIDAPCYECLHKHVDDSAMNCAENGVAGPVVGIIGTMQAMEGIRLLCKIGSSSAGKFQNFDARTMAWQTFKVLKRLDCAACGNP
jgi:adenylyltransferase/sulfurtransferase